MGDVTSACVVGSDVDPVAVALCRMNLALACGGESRAAESAAARVRVCDAALDDRPIREALGGAHACADVVVGNPPFLSQLAAATAHPRERAAALEAQLGPAVRGYADGAGAFLLRALSLVRDGGRVAMIQPLSFLAARDGRPLRAEVASRGEVEAVWVCPERVFDASVLTCAPVVRTGRKRLSAPRITVGSAFRAATNRASAGVDLGAEQSWSHLIADATGAPYACLRPNAALIGDVARATADFRDQYYGLRGAIIEDGALRGAGRDGFPRLITTAMLGAGECEWGVRSVRAFGVMWRAPRVDLSALAKDSAMAAWARARLVPKALVATQTKRIEAWCDERGDCLPLVPIITVTAPTPGDLRRVVAALGSAPLTALAYRRRAGAALSADAIKLSAADLLELPLDPADVQVGPDLEAWWARRCARRGGIRPAAPDTSRRTR